MSDSPGNGIWAFADPYRPATDLKLYSRRSTLSYGLLVDLEDLIAVSDDDEEASE